MDSDYPSVSSNSSYTYVRFVFTSSYLKEASCLVFVICICLHTVVSNSYCIMFFFSSSSSCLLVSYVASFAGLLIFDFFFDIL